MSSPELYCPDKSRKKCREGKSACKTAALHLPLAHETGEGGYLVCRACMHIITSTTEKIEINGSHIHGFTNPHGLYFDLGCFRHAPGCGYSKESSYEFTWFSGYAWRIAVCRTCYTHLGWLFTSGASRFNGLILNKLMAWDAPGVQPSQRHDL